MTKYYCKINAVVLLFIYFLALCGQNEAAWGQNEAAAQIAKEVNKIDRQNYAVAENDMRCYQVICKATDKNEYAAYYKLIREKIKEKLKSNYRYGYTKDDINVSFILNFDGSLVNLYVNRDSSSKNRELVELTALSVKQASPFPPFPKAMPRSPVSFSVKVSFRNGYTEDI